MYISFLHFLIPKISCIGSFIVNPLTVYIVWNDKKLNLGNYRYLLLYFACFNLVSSLADMLVPMCVLNHRYAFSVFISDGLFESYSEFHQFIIALRCSFISVTYAVLHAHFLYRFLVLFNNQILADYFMPYGLLLTIAYSFFHVVFWTVACWHYLGGDFDRRMYIREPMFEMYGTDSLNMTIIIAQYREGPFDALLKSWIGIGSMSVLSIFSLSLIFVLGYQIVTRLRSQTMEMSEKTKKLQTQLMKALVVQAAIPTCVSFSPCLFAWYQPVFGLNLGRWIQISAAAAVSTFPCLDPLAIIFFVPTFRNQFREIVLFMAPKKKNQTTCSQTPASTAYSTQN